MRSLAVACILAASIGAAAAQNEDKGAMMGAGMLSCADFAKHYRDDQTIELTYFTWTQGFMSGLNILQAALKKPMRDLKGWPLDQQQLHIRLFCNERPLSLLAQAAQNLYHKLPEIPQQ